MADTENRLAVGTFTVVQLNAGDYLIEERALASDQPSPTLMPWMVSDASDFPRKPTYDITVGGRQKPNGFDQWTWVLFPLTMGMLHDFEDDIFNGEEDVAVTVKTLLANGDYSTYHARLLKPVPGQHYKLVDGVIQDYTLRFISGVLLGTGIYA